MSEPDLTTRMRSLRVEVAPDVAERQIRAIRGELQERRRQPSSERARVSHRHPGRRRLAGALAMSLILLFPVAALAAEETVPGDTLYVVKQSTEWVRSLVDDDVAGRHRARELEISIDRGDPIGIVVERFEASVAAIDDSDVSLIGRVERSRQRIRDRYGVDPASVGPRSTSPTDGRGGDGRAGDGRGGDGRDGLGRDVDVSGLDGERTTDVPETDPVSDDVVTNPVTTSATTSTAGGTDQNGATTRSTIGKSERAPGPGDGSSP